MCYTLCHAEEADRLTKHLLPINTVEAVDSSTPLRSAQNDSAHLTSDPEVTHDVFKDIALEGEYHAHEESSSSR